MLCLMDSEGDAQILGVNHWEWVRLRKQVDDFPLLDETALDAVKFPEFMAGELSRAQKQ